MFLQFRLNAPRIGACLALLNIMSNILENSFHSRRHYSAILLIIFVLVSFTSPAHAGKLSELLKNACGKALGKLSLVDSRSNEEIQDFKLMEASAPSNKRQLQHIKDGYNEPNMETTPDFFDKNVKNSLFDSSAVDIHLEMDEAGPRKDARTQKIVSGELPEASNWIWISIAMSDQFNLVKNNSENFEYVAKSDHRSFRSVKFYKNVETKKPQIILTFNFQSGPTYKSLNLKSIVNAIIRVREECEDTFIVHIDEHPGVRNIVIDVNKFKPLTIEMFIALMAIDTIN